MAKRRRKSPTAKQRRKYGTKRGPKKGSYPIYSQRTALSAIRLRGHRKGKSRKSILDRASRWGRSHNNSRVLAAVKRARAKDRKKS